MKLKFSRLLAAAGVAALAIGAGAAQARDVYWSVGVNAAPGVAIGVGNAPVYAPRPVYYAPQPVYVAPPPPVYYAPAPVYYAPPPVAVYYGPNFRGYRGHYGHHGHRH